MGENPTDLRDYYKPLTCKDSAGNEYICLNEYEAKAIVELINKVENMSQTIEVPGLRFNTGDWYRDVPEKINKWLSKSPPTSLGSD